MGTPKSRYNSKLLRFVFDPFEGFELEAKERESLIPDISEIVERGIKEHLDKGRSPVKRLRSFKDLTDEYAKNKKGGRKTANLQLSKDMIRAVKARKIGPGHKYMALEIDDRTQAKKADGHCHLHKGNKHLPVRRFIPGSNQELKSAITDEIRKLIKERKKDGF